MLENILKAPDNLPYKAMASARSDALSKVRELDQALAGKQAGLAKKMAELFDESMITAADKSKIPGLSDEIRAANKFTADEHKMFEQALVKKVVDTKKPEAIATLIRNPNIGNQETRDLFAILPKQLHQPVQRQIIMDTMRQSVNLNTKMFNERRFAETLAKIGDERGKIIFGSNWKNIKELTSIMERINGPVGMQGGAGAALQNFSALKNLMLTVAAPLSLSSHGEYGKAAGSLAAEWVSLNILAGAMTHPATAAKMLSVAQGFARTLPYMATGAYEVGRKSGAIEKSAGQTLQDVKDKAMKAMEPAPVAQPAAQPSVQAPVVIPQQLYDEDGNPVGPQSSAKPTWTHMYNPSTGQIEAV